MRTVKTNYGEIPIEDYLEMEASSYGYDSYEELYNDGYRIAGYEDVTPESLKVNL